MLQNNWEPSNLAAEKLREYVYFKPGIHWRSSPLGQRKPWSPEAIYNVNECKKVIKKHLLLGINQLAA